MEDDFVGAIKIKDGLFIGDEYAAQDFEFIVTNKVTHIINCAGKQIPNYWETVGVVYLTYDWMDSENQVVFDAKGEVVNDIFNFVEEAVKMGEGVLVHSLKGQSRSCCVLTAYFMKRYRWSLYKTLEFLTSRRSDLEIRTSFYHQLLNLESRLFQQVDGHVTVNWHEVGPENDHEEALLRNTFLNARNAPFDEALVNPQAQGVEPKSRKLNWGDEKVTHKTGLHSFFTKESLAARLAKPLISNIKSILKGSGKIFKLKHKTQEDDSAGSSKTTSAANSGMRMHKSVRNLSEGRGAADSSINDATKISEKDAGIVEKYQESKNSKNTNMHRSSSATYLEREENSKSPISNNKSAIATTGDKAANGKVSNINGNIIHLTVNNYLAPVNNLSNATQNSGSAEGKDPSTKPPIGAQTQGSRTALQKYNSAIEAKKEDGIYSSNKGLSGDSSTSNLSANQTVEKSMMSTNQLKSAIEKKLSKEYKSQMPSLQKGDAPVIVTKISTNNDRNTTDAKSAKTAKEYSKPNDIKVNYQVLLKSRETPPPRKREDAKKIPESPQRKAVSKSSVSTTKGNTDSNLPYSSYLNNLFSTSFSHLNTVTPSAYATNYSNGDKKTPISTKATTPMTYNLNLSQKAQTLTRPQRATSNQNTDKDYNSSTLGSSLTKSKLVYTNTPNSASNLATKYNNYLAQTKNNPVRITYEKIDRPHSATPDRSVTPQAGVRRMGTPSNVGLNRSGGTIEQRLSVPTKGTKHTKKDSGSTQDLLAKYRQRSSSPSQMSYNPVLSSSALSSKSRPKY